MLGASRLGLLKEASSILLFRTQMRGLLSQTEILEEDKHIHLTVLEICEVSPEMVQAATILLIIEGVFNLKIMDLLACQIILRL